MVLYHFIACALLKQTIITCSTVRHRMLQSLGDTTALSRQARASRSGLLLTMQFLLCGGAEGSDGWGRGSVGMLAQHL